MIKSKSLVLSAAAAVLAAAPCFADDAPTLAADQMPIGSNGNFMPQTETQLLERMRRLAAQPNAKPAVSPKGFDASPVKMAPLATAAVPLTATVGYRLEAAGGPAAVGATTLFSPGNRMSLENAIFDAMIAAGLPVHAVLAGPDGSGTINFRTNDFGSIHVDVFPGPSARGSVNAPSRELLDKVLGKQGTVWVNGEGYSIFLADAFTLQGTVMIPAQNIPPSIYQDKAAKVNFWSTAEVSIQGEGTPLQQILQNTEATVGPIAWDGNAPSISIMGLSLSGNALTYQPTLPLKALGLELKMKDKIVVKDFGPPQRKTPEGGLMVAAEYSAKGLKRTPGGGVDPVGEEASSLFYNGAGVADGQRIVTTASQYRTALEASFGHTGGGRELYSGKSWFCEGLFAGEGAPQGAPQEVWYDRFETASGDMLLLRMNYLKVSVSLSLTKDQIRFDDGQSEFAHMLFYLCPSPAN